MEEISKKKYSLYKLSDEIHNIKNNTQKKGKKGKKLEVKGKEKLTDLAEAKRQIQKMKKEKRSILNALGKLNELKKELESEKEKKIPWRDKISALTKIHVDLEKITTDENSYYSGNKRSLSKKNRQAFCH